MRNKICIVICYFGKLPEIIDSFLYSCKNNPEIDWIIFTDCEKENLPDNVRLIKTTLSEMKKLAEEKINMTVRLESPYKLCDYKIAYGLIFEDYLKDYDFWGYGDLDVIYGDLKDYFKDELLEKYDKIFPLGHLSLIRNDECCKKIFMSDVNGTSYYKNVFNTDVSCFFDEDNGINDKFEALGYKVYSKFDFVDVDGAYKRFRNVDKKTLRITLPKFKYLNNLRKNYKNQIFYLKDKKLYQGYIQNGEINVDEIAYIHYRRKLKNKWNENDKIMVVCPKGIIGTGKTPDENDIQYYNKKEEIEIWVFLKFLFEKAKVRLPAILKDRIISTLGKSNTLRKIVRKIKNVFAEDK